MKGAALSSHSLKETKGAALSSHSLKEMKGAALSNHSLKGVSDKWGGRGLGVIGREDDEEMTAVHHKSPALFHARLPFA
jgi:hypothetical protein